MKQESEIRKFGWISFSAILHAAILGLAVFLPANSIEHNPLETVDIVEVTTEDKTVPPVLEPEPAVARQSVAQATSPVPATPKSAPISEAPKPEAPKPAPQPKIVRSQAPKAAVLPPSVISDDSDVVVAKEPAPEKKESPPEKQQELPKKMVKADPVPPTPEPEATADEPEEDAAPVVAVVAAAPPPPPAPLPVAKVAAAAAPVAVATKPTSAASGTEAGTGSATKGSPANAEKLRAAPAVVNKPPLYPEDDRKAQKEGSVRIRFYVNSDGSVGKPEILKNTGSDEMGKNALGNLKNYRYDSNQTGWWEKDFKFSLNGESEEYGGTLRR